MQETKVLPTIQQHLYKKQTIPATPNSTHTHKIQKKDSLKNTPKPQLVHTSGSKSMEQALSLPFNRNCDLQGWRNARDLSWALGEHGSCPSLSLLTEKKKKAQPKVWELYFIQGHTEGLSQEAATQITLRGCSKGVKGEPGYIGVFAVNSYIVGGHPWLSSG